MSTLPERIQAEEFADSMIKLDKYVSLSIREGYMTREEYIISTWMNSYCNKNDIPLNCSKQEAYIAASQEFNISSKKAEELYQRSLSIRSRHMDLDKL